jgi:hypothetical protein
MIVAKNAVLGDILRAVSEKTGASIDVPEGATERVVSQLGPGPARDVIAALLNGSHFNYVMVGTQDSPNSVAQVVFTAKTDGSKTDTGKGATPGSVVATNTPYPTAQPPTSRGRAIMQSIKEMSEQQHAQELVTPDFQAQLPTPTTTSEPVAAAATPDAASAPAAAAGVPTSPASAGTETAAAAAGVAASPASGGTETAAVADAPASGEAPKAPSAERTPQQVLQDMYEARRQMMQAQRQPPPSE